MSECSCCRGRRYVRLALDRPAKVVYGGPMPPEAGEVAYKDYACPECKADAVPFSNIVTLTDTSRIPDGYYRPPDLDATLRGIVAMRLARQMLDKGLIEFRWGRSNGRDTPFGGTVNVVSKEASASLEQRVAARQAEVAREFYSEAQIEIHNWASASRYVDGHIDKQQAMRLICQALERVLERRKA